MNRRLPLLLVALVLALPGCGGPTEPGADVCPQTSEFGNFGCTRLVVLPGDVPEDVPETYRWNVEAEGGSGAFTFLEFGTDPLPERVEGTVTLWRQLPGGADTATVPVVVEILDDTRPVEVGVPLPLVAVDSLRHTFRFAEVGERPDVDTLRLDPRPVEGG